MKKLKQIISLTLVVVLFMMCSVSVLATGKIEVSNGENFVTEEMALADKEETEALIKQGAALRKVRAATINLNVPLLYQDDSRWINTIVPGTSSTYGAKGCALTCYAMVSRKYGNSTETPVTFGQKYYNAYGNPLNHTSVNAAAVLGKSATTAMNLSYTEWENFILGALNSGKPVVLKTNKFGTHFVVAYGYYRDSSANAEYTIYIRDPESHDNGTTLDDYFQYDILQGAAIG